MSACKAAKKRVMREYSAMNRALREESHARKRLEDLAKYGRNRSKTGAAKRKLKAEIALREAAAKVKTQANKLVVIDKMYSRCLRRA